MDRYKEQAPEARASHLLEAQRNHALPILCELLGENNREKIQEYLSVPLDQDLADAYRGAPHLLTVMVDFLHLTPLADDPHPNDSQFTEWLLKIRNRSLEREYDRMLDPKNNCMELFRCALQNQRIAALLNQHFRQENLEGPILKTLVDSVGFVLEQIGVQKPTFIDQSYTSQETAKSGDRFHRNLASLSQIMQKSLDEAVEQEREKDREDGVDEKFVGRKAKTEARVIEQKIFDLLNVFPERNKFLDMEPKKIRAELAALLLKFPNFRSLGETLFDLQEDGKICLTD